MRKQIAIIINSGNDDDNSQVAGAVLYRVFCTIFLFYSGYLPIPKHSRQVLGLTTAWRALALLGTHMLYGTCSDYSHFQKGLAASPTCLNC
jgi:hypothetical protein